MTNATNLDFTKLADWLEGRLPDVEAQAIQARLSSLPDDTLADLEWLRNFIQTSQSTVLAAPPPEIRANLSQIFEQFAQDRRPPTLFQRLVATLTFDSYGQPGMAGVRSTATAETQRQIIYFTAMADIALNLQPQPNKQFIINGQVMPSIDMALDSFDVTLLRGDEELDLIRTDDLGEFSFGPISAGRYELIVAGQSFEALVALTI